MLLLKGVRRWNKFQYSDPEGMETCGDVKSENVGNYPHILSSPVWRNTVKEPITGT